MKCYYCGSKVRPSTIICPVCNRLQNINLFERLVDYLKRQLTSDISRNRSKLLSR